jgi:hypothetical protein
MWACGSSIGLQVIYRAEVRARSTFISSYANYSSTARPASSTMMHAILSGGDGWPAQDVESLNISGLTPHNQFLIPSCRYALKSEGKAATRLQQLFAAT